jgi:type II secretory pathway predicted ATPase ExeA
MPATINSSPITLKAFFGYTRHPFPPSCSPEPLFRHEALDAALDALKNALMNRMHVLVTAAAGQGKSSFCRLLVSELNPRDLRAAYLVGQPVGPTEMLHKVADALGLETAWRRGQAAKLLTAGLQKLTGSPGAAHPVLILDEAQQVSLPAIDLLRLVAEEGSRTLLSLVLVGDETLRRQLCKQAWAPLAGRMAVRIQLPPLSEEQTARFVEHAFQAVGMQNLLSPTAVAPVHAASGGSPREIGAILSAAMRRAVQKRSKMLTDEIVQEVIDERRS